MSKKVIAFQTSKKSANAGSPVAPAKISPPRQTEADWWVHQPEAYSGFAAVGPVEPAPLQQTAASVTVTISAEPDWFEAVKIGFLLPSMTVWWWMLGAARRNLQLFAG